MTNDDEWGKGVTGAENLKMSCVDNPILILVLC